MESHGSFTLPQLIRELDEETACQRLDGDADGAKRAEKLLDRLSLLKELDGLTAGPGAGPESKAPATILQMSAVSPMARDMLLCFCIALLWEEIRQNGEAPPYDALLLDELQSIPLTRTSALWSMLREARKFHVQMILCTQSLSSYDKEQRAMLTQTGHQLFFRPPLADLSLVAKLLDGDWSDTLSHLQRGQALLTGKYHLDKSRAVAATPLVVQFLKSTPE